MGPFEIIRRSFGVLISATVAMAALLAAPAAHAGGDPLRADQWVLAKIGAPTAWTASAGTGVKIAIVDTGVDLTHEDLAAKVVAHADCRGGAGCRSGGVSDGNDGNGHGTHVAGVAAAVTGNDVGVSGVAPDAMLVVAKALEDDGTGVVADVDAAIRWAVDQGAAVINLSLGPEIPALSLLPGESITAAVSHAWQRGAAVVISAGNGNALFQSSDYSNLDAVVVGATGPDDTIASYSSAINAKYGIVAPGGDGDCRGQGGIHRCVLSTYFKNRYALQRGTSMAAPQVSGALALLLAQGLSRDAAVQRLLDTADPSVNCGRSCRGRLDVAAAVAASTPTPPAPSDGTGDTGAGTDDGLRVLEDGGNPGDEPSPEVPGGGQDVVSQPAVIVAPVPAPPPAPAVTTPAPVVVTPEPAGAAGHAPPPPAADAPPSGHSSPDAGAGSAPDAGAGSEPPGTDTEEPAQADLPPQPVPVPVPAERPPRLRLRLDDGINGHRVLMEFGAALALAAGASRLLGVRRRLPPWPAS